MKKLRFVLSAIIVFIALTFALAVFVSAEDGIQSGTWGELTWELNETTGELVVSGNGYMDSLSGSDTDAWLAHGNKIKTIVIREGVKSIGLHAFKNSENLTSISIPDSVESIGYLAFLNCNKLAEITIPNSCTRVDDGAFTNCENIATIVAPSCAIEALPNRGVRDLTITDGTSIPDAAFQGMFGVISISIPDTVTSIGNFAFYNCSSLKSLQLPEGVTSIGYQAFQNCKSLESINIPSGITSLADSIFLDCEKLSSISLPEGLTDIGRDAFRRCKSLTSVTIPQGVTAIKSATFESCHSLTEIILHDGITRIEDHAFDDCIGLKKVVIPDGICTISGYAFNTTFHIETAVLPISAISYIPTNNMKTVIFTSGTGIPDNAFKGCTTLEKVAFCGTEDEWKSVQQSRKWMVNLKNVKFVYHDCQWETTDTTHIGTCIQCGTAVAGTHAWDSGTVTVFPTHFETGTQTYTCVDCGIGKTAMLDKTPYHFYGAWTDHNEQQHKRSCECGDVEYRDHAYSTWITLTPATEENEGQEHKMCVCGRKVLRSIPALEHEYDSKVFEPTCTEKGYTEHICKNCKDSYKDSYVEALGHAYDDSSDMTCNVCKESRQGVNESDNEYVIKPGKEKFDYGIAIAVGCGAVILVVGIALGIYFKKKKK